MMMSTTVLAGQKPTRVLVVKGRVAMLQSERKAKKEHLVFLPMKKSYRKE